MNTAAVKILQRAVALRDKTTFRIGGDAAWYAAPSTAAQIAQVSAWAREHAVPVCVMGNGSNVLISDAGWPGLVIDISRHFRAMEWDGTAVRCGAGAALASVVRQSVGRSLCGIERLAGIPGTIGGGLVMNAGAFDQEIGACVEWVDIIDMHDVAVRRVQRGEMRFGYRSSSLRQDGTVIVGAQLRLREGDGRRIRRDYEEVLGKRAEKQPLDKPNCGSVFKRPPGHYAGALIEHCGLKGLRAGDAMVSEKHANFIVNLGSATAEDVRAIIARVQKCVYENTKVLLEPEVIFIGEFQTPLYTP